MMIGDDITRPFGYPILYLSEPKTIVTCLHSVKERICLGI